THGIYPSRDGRRMYISNRGWNTTAGGRHGPGSITVLDAATERIVATWPVPGGGSPDMGNVSADGRELWLSGRYDDEVYVFDAATDRLERLAADLRRGDRASVQLAAVDVRDRAAVNRAATELSAGGYVPDVLLNNAGLASGMSKIYEGDPEDWDRMIDTNLKGLLNVTRAVLPHMVARRRGHVVNIGSTAGHMTYP